MFDMHLHTNASHDSKAVPGEIIRMASGIGLSGIAFTDHFDNYKSTEENNALPILNSYRNFLDSREEAARLKLRLLFGMEAGGGIRNPDNLKRLAGRLPFDVIIGSVHEIYYRGENVSLYDFDFRTLPPETLALFVETYYRDLYATMNTCDVDVCAHIDLIDRYIVGKHGIDYDRGAFRECVEAILELIIAKNIALEVNTSSCAAYGFTMPGPGILRTYKAMGGELLTVGSDAHVPGNTGGSFGECLEMIKSCGFRRLFYYSARKPFAYGI